MKPWRHRLVCVLALAVLSAACAWYMLPEGRRRELTGELREFGRQSGPERILPEFGDSGLTVHYLDVGQGDAVLVESAGHFMLVDAGENAYADKVVTYLHEQGVEALDYAVGTHPHSDHIGGLDDVLENFKSEQVILSPVVWDTWTFRHLHGVIRQQGLQVWYPEPGTVFTLGEAEVLVLAPAGDYGETVNNWSVALRITYGETAFLLTGDAEAEAEHDLCQSGAPLRADVLKLGHHGSSTSTTWELLDAVSPSAVVISCGLGNDYEYPHRITMEKLAGVEVYRTDEQGTVTAKSDGRQILWNVPPGRKTPGSKTPGSKSPGADDDGKTRESKSVETGDKE